MKNKNFINSKTIISIFLTIFLSIAAAAQNVELPNEPDGSTEQTTAFTYQGRLSDSSMAASGTFDFQFAIYSLSSGGALIGTRTIPNVTVTNGIFNVKLDFGTAGFPEDQRYLEIRVKRPSDTNYTTLDPRQEITSAPYAIRAKNAGTATTANNALAVGGTAAGNIIKEGDTRLTDARTPTAGSANYIQNTTTQQTSANFNIDGTGTANIFNAVTQYNIGGSRVLSSAGEGNLFAGIKAGQSNTTGGNNSFVGSLAGNANTTGVANSFVGAFAGQSNTTGFGNSFVGAFAGFFNTMGSFNSFFGSNAGDANTTGGNNSFIGTGAGSRNTTGNDNSFVGAFAGKFNTSGGSNSFVGQGVGLSNTTGSYNTLIGDSADVSADNLTYATAVGSGATVSTSNTVVLGRTDDTVIAPNTLQVNTLGAAGDTSLCRNASNQISTCTQGNRSEMNSTAAAAKIDRLGEQVKQQAELIEQQQIVINGLKKIVCSQNPNADVCK